MRGKARCHAQLHNDAGITPAYAGKSHIVRGLVKLVKDHPRVCGEKYSTRPYLSDEWGSPPRMRGKGAGREPAAGKQRITPAYAGKSGHAINPNVCGQDHPRVCGEKSPFSLFRPPHLGSPPRMRGKGISCCCRKRPGGITPAYAGKSSQTAEHPSIMQDHPRVCGEKSSPTSSHRKGQGSPPRMRGKALAPAPTIDIIGITPAYAGKRK